MKNTVACLFAFMLFSLIALFAPTVAFAQEVASAAAETVVAPDPFAAFVAGLTTKYPVVVTILTLIGLLRLLVKPVIAYLHSRAAATESPDDDARLEKAERSWWFKALMFGLDWTASIKPIGRK